MNGPKNKKTQALIQLALFAGIVILLNILVNVRIGGRGLYANIDLTEEKRFTLSPATKAMLEDINDIVFVKVLLEGDFPAPLKQLQRSTLEMLEDFRSVSPYIEFDFEDPSGGNGEQLNALKQQLAEWELEPTFFETTDAAQVVYPFAIVRYGNRVFPVDLLDENIPGAATESERLEISISQLEYKLANAIQKITQTANDRQYILFTEGHGELDSLQTFDLQTSLQSFYNIDRIHLDSVITIPSDLVKLLVVAKPRSAFSDRDKFKIDQYVMSGGKVLWMIDHVAMDLDTLMRKQRFYPAPYDLQLDDLWFKYGIRFQDDFVLDYQCSSIALTMGAQGTPPRLFKYPYFPVLVPNIAHPITKGLGLNIAHPITKGLGLINLKYPSGLDMDVQLAPGLERTLLLQSSENSMYQRLPVEMDFAFLREPLRKEAFQKLPQPLAMLIEGEFPSFYANRMSAEMQEGMKQLNIEIRDHSEPTAMIVVADGDIARNEVNYNNGKVLPLGFSPYEGNGKGYTFTGNKDFLINCVEYLVNEHGVFEARGKEVKLRLLDRMKAETQKVKWQVINLVLPLVFLLLFGFAYNWWRKRKYS
ncbi:MAG: gliding motility-associated ABC transporter substrate-binding protein GldG [Saprospiraceae bacterium]|nr:gliding motility-associated ABC transporter substrate-binding protein GldG [Lewinella sp.]